MVVVGGVVAKTAGGGGEAAYANGGGEAATGGGEAATGGGEKSTGGGDDERVGEDDLAEGANHGLNPTDCIQAILSHLIVSQSSSTKPPVSPAIHKVN